jgi:hypothetical protein
MSPYLAGKITVLFAVTIFISCENKQPVSTNKTQINFTDVTATAGLANFRHVTGAVGDKWFPESMGSGGGFIDYNGDGWSDILLVGGGAWPGKSVAVAPALILYHNNLYTTRKGADEN